VSTTRGRLVFTNQVVYDQADFFQVDGFTRVSGLLPVQMSCTLYFNNSIQPWVLVPGTGVPDLNVSAGRIYWQEIPGGAYGIRFRPNAIGYWRIVVVYPAGFQIVAQDYDVNAGTGVQIEGGLRASFSPGGSGGGF
jgi:hypothetical protein